MPTERRWHPEAALEAQAARRWYRDQEAPEAAAKFRVALRRALDEVSEAPLRWPVLDGALRKRPLRDFPYRVVYEPRKSYVLIIAVMHERQRPGYWSERVDGLAEFASRMESLVKGAKVDLDEPIDGDVDL